MSLRKVSDLEGLNYESIYNDRNLSNQLLDSLIEVSFPEKTVKEDGVQLWSYKSMYSRYFDIKSNIMRTILCGDTDPEDPDPHPSVIFYTSAFFEQPVNMLCSLYLSGNFYLNLEYADDEILNGTKDLRRGGSHGYETYVRTTQNILCAIGESGDDAVGNNILTAYRDNYIMAGDSNVIDSLGTKFEADGSPVADFYKDRVEFHVPVNIEDDLHVDGDIYVDKDVYAKFFRGIALSAYWADLAEFYQSDEEYQPGTLVQFGGDKEITIAKTDVNAVVSTSPAYVMNAIKDSDGINCPIALAGKIPVKVIGPIRKFDKIVLSDIPGIGIRCNTNNQKQIIARSLEDNDDSNIKLVNCVTKFSL